MYLFISLQTFAAKSVNFRNTSDVSSHKHGQSISMSYLARGTVKKWRLLWKSYKFLLVVFWGSSHSGSTMIGWLLDARADWTSFNKFHWGCQTPGWRWPVVVSATPHLGGKAPVTIIIGCYYQVHSWNFNMKPENDDFQQGISNCRGPFSGSMWIFGAVEQFSGFAAILLDFGSSNSKRLLIQLWFQHGKPLTSPLPQDIWPHHESGCVRSKPMNLPSNQLEAYSIWSFGSTWLARGLARIGIRDVGKNGGKQQINIP